MSNLTQSTQRKQVSSYVSNTQAPIYAAAKLYQGAMVCLRVADGYAVRAGTAGTGPVIGIARAEAAAPSNSGDYNVNLLCGVFELAVHASRPPTIAEVGKLVYASDDQTVSKTSTDGPIAGVLVGLTADGNALVKIGPEEQPVTIGAVGFPIASTILAAGTPMAAFADNVGASAPGVTLVNSKAVGLRWNNQGTQTAVYGVVALPDDLDPNYAATIEVYASKTGATVGDATTFDVGLFNNAVGALHDADTNYGGTTSAMTGNATAKTVQKVTLTLTATDLGVSGEPLTFSIKPTDGTLGTDDVVCHGVSLKYTRKRRTS